MPSTATRSTSSLSMTLSREISPTHSRTSPPLSTLRPHCPDVESPRISSRYVTSLVTFRALAYASGSQITREGALNVVRQAVAAGVKHISFLGTIAALLDLTNPLVKAPLSDKDWNPLTEEFALGSGSPVLVYTVAKTQSEQVLWKFAEEHPELNLTTGTSWV